MATADRSPKMECPGCGYKCVPQWLNDEATCLKCFNVLRRRAVGAGIGSGEVTQDFARRQPGEASTFKYAPGKALTAEGGACSKAPKGVHLFKFGKCSFCAAAEPPKGKAALGRPGSGPGTYGGRPTTPVTSAPSSALALRAQTPTMGGFAVRSSPPATGTLLQMAGPAGKACAKCQQSYAGHGDVCAGCRRATDKKGTTKQCMQCQGFFHGFGETCEDCAFAPPPPTPPAAVRERPRSPATVQRNERSKVECPHCGYKCVPQWLNDEAHCLKCQAVLKVQDNIHGGGPMQTTPMVARRQAGEVSTFKAAPGDPMLKTSPGCTRSPTNNHLWKFGKCEFCGQAEGKLIGGKGALANPGGAGGGCAAGGKCMFKFAKCTKCGKKGF